MIIKDEQGISLAWGLSKSIEQRARRRAFWVACFVENLPSGSRILEIGPGLGYLTELLVKKNLSVTTVEQSEKIYRMIKNKMHRLKVTIINKNFLDLNWSDTDERYHALVGVGILHHFWYHPEWSHLISKPIRNGGKIVFLEPNPRNIIAQFIFNTRFGRYLFSLDPKECLKKEPMIIRDLQKAGFNNITISPCDLMYPLPVNLPAKYFDQMEKNVPQFLLKLTAQSILIYAEKTEVT
ncbi:MAG: class I SAM-dependent methyltransferase [Bdellovibrionaceae bacterium]|nr:class I SAM-dependent methyltransferase [Pseudobdellovibrionaceae bacterium]MDW8189923.1 methyltransferase domain-containing protein [Pseudobdellovibrionaceae bacterium]